MAQMMLPVGDDHELCVDTFGTQTGIPAVYLHGGPGSGCQPAHSRLFDPAVFRAVLFDQRGAGRSTPHRSRTANTTTDLISDMELIRERLNIERWLLVGGSWGATLALAYAQTYPERVSGLVLRAVFLGTRRELDWAFGTGLSTFYPDLYADFLSLLSPEEKNDPIEAYWRRILDPEPGIHAPFARAWHDTERVLSQARPSATRLDLKAIHNPATPVPSTPAMEAHYFSNDCFLTPDQLLLNADRLAGIPGIIVQGQFDLLCPPRTSWALTRIWQDVNIEIIPGAGHAQSEPGVAEAMKAAIASMQRTGRH